MDEEPEIASECSSSLGKIMNKGHGREALREIEPKLMNEDESSLKNASGPLRESELMPRRDLA